MLEAHPTRNVGRVFVGRIQEMAQLESALDDVGLQPDLHDSELNHKVQLR